jgi:hypothetical protein
LNKKSFEILSVVFGVALIGTISFSSAYASTIDQNSSVRSGGLAITGDMVTPFGGGQVGGGTWAYDTTVSNWIHVADNALQHES